MVGATPEWTQDLERWLRPFLGRLNHKTRRRMCPAYVSGLSGRVSRRHIESGAQSRTLRCRNSIASLQLVCALAACWRMPAMVKVCRSAKGSRFAN